MVIGKENMKISRLTKLYELGHMELFKYLEVKIKKCKKWGILSNL